MALPDLTVEIAFDSGYTTAAASRTWTDVSAYVEGAQPISISRGRSDEVSQVQPSRLALTLNNKDGRFTPRLTTGAYYPNVKKGRPIRVTATYNAVDYVRYTGYVAEWPVSWPDSSSAVCVVNLTSASRMARLGRGAELRSIVEEEILADSPIAFYTLGEPADSTSAADTSGNQAPPLTMAGTGTDVVFGNATGPGTDGLTAAEFAGGKWLSVTLGSVPVALECSFATTTNDATPRAILAVAGTIGPTLLNGNLGAGGGGSAGGPVADGLVHHVLWDGASIYLDGVLTSLIGTAPSASLSPVVGVGGSLNPSLGAPFIGSIAHAAVHDSSPSAARALAHSDAGSDGFAGESAGARITRLARYGGVPAAEVSADAGSSTIGHFDITGMTPVAAMQKVVETENGVLFDARDGTLTFTGRDARYNLTSSFTLDVTAQEVEADLEPKDDDQFLVNDVTVTANGVPAGRVVDITSLDENGHYAQSLDTVTDDTDDALQGANWKVAKGADPEPRYSQVTVDITNSSTAQAAAVLAADVGTRFTLSNLPDQVESTADLFVEGYAETITTTSHRITFNTSPATGYDVFTLNDATFGELDGAYPLAF